MTAGSEISDLYDPMIAKLIVHDADRERARRRMLRALEEFEIGGVKTLVGFHRALLEHPCFVAGETCHGVVESEELARRAEEFSPRTGRRRGAGRRTSRAARSRSSWTAAASRSRCCAPSRATASWRAAARSAWPRRAASGTDAVVSPMQGTVIEVRVAEGDEVEEGAVICIVEAMKMENELTAHRAGVVTQLSVAPGDAGRVRPDDLRRLGAGHVVGQVTRSACPSLGGDLGSSCLTARHGSRNSNSAGRRATAERQELLRPARGRCGRLEERSMSH